MNSDKLKEIVEVLIFASDTPITIKQMQSVIEDAKAKQIEKIIDTLNNDYRQTGRTFAIVQVAGGYQMISRNSYSQWIRKLFHRKIKARLSQAALETLSVIAFKQPVSRTEVEAVRGVNCDGVVRTLLERKLIILSGRGDGPGKPLLYKTTDEFLRYFGINEITDLPKPREIEEILKEEKKPEDVEGIEALQAEHSKSQSTDKEIKGEPLSNDDSNPQPDTEKTGKNTGSKGDQQDEAAPENIEKMNEIKSTDSSDEVATKATSETLKVNNATE